MVRNYILLILFTVLPLWAQRPAEIGVITDNDLYTSPVNDQYYTNGIEFYYRYLSKPRKETTAKKITEFRAGQYIYAPQSVIEEDIRYHDRPYAGYLFGEAGISNYYKSENVLKMNFQLGIVGPESLAQDVQEGLHEVLGYHTVRGWQYQIQSLVGLQAEVVYATKILRKHYSEKIDFYMQGEIKAGTVWNSVSVGPMMRISLNKNNLIPIYDSALYNAALRYNKEEYKGRKELFLYVNPVINYQLYDATIEGSMFNDDSVVTFPLIPFRFNAEVGVKYAREKWSLSYSFNYRGKELSNNVITGYYYGSIAIGYFL